MDLVRKRQKLILGIDIRQRNKQGRVILCKSFAHFVFHFNSTHTRKFRGRVGKGSFGKSKQNGIFIFWKKGLGNVKEVLLKNAFVQLPFFSKMQHILSRSFNSLPIAIM